MRILMVCLGNICRSPIAEGVMRQKIKEHGLDWTVASAGTESYHIGEEPHRLSQKVCSMNGIDISSQRAEKFTHHHLDKYDKIYAFADDVYREIERIGKGKPMTNVDYFLNELHLGGNRSVPDPYYGGEEGYHKVYELIEMTCNAIIARYKKDGGK